MKKLIFVSLCVAMMLAVISCKTSYLIVDPQPFPPIYALADPISPNPAYVWMDGDWIVKNNEYIWSEGSWSKPHGKKLWHRGGWEAAGDGWYWRLGCWE
jgi:hypothetical protein